MECVPEHSDLKEMGEEELWELINDNRHRISLGVRPFILIPYLRQARVLTEMDEDEIVSCHNLTNRSMRTSEISDLMCYFLNEKKTKQNKKNLCMGLWSTVVCFSL